MVCTSGCLTEQKGSPCLKGLPNVEELSQANLNSGFFICFNSVCRRARGDGSVLSSQPYVHIPEAGTAVAVLVSHMKTWQRRREERGWKREWETAKTGAAAAHPEPDCAMGSKQPKWLHPWKHSPQSRLLCNSRVLLICLHEMNSCAAFAPSCAETTAELGCSALQELLAPLDAHKLQHWLELLDEAQLELNPRIVLCQTILSLPLHLPSFPSQPFSTSVNLNLPSKCVASTRYPNLWTNMPWHGSFCSLLYFRKTLCFKKGRRFLNKPLLFKENNRCWGF